MNVDAENGGVSGEENGNVEDVEVALRVGWNVNDGHAESEEVDVPGGFRCWCRSLWNRWSLK